jgi:quinol monooxygenase YgiN
MLALATGLLVALGISAVLWSRTGEQSGKRTAATPRADGVVARLWELQVDPAQLDAFRAVGAENQEASIRLEPGVLMMHAVQLAHDPSQVRVLEVYSNQSAYESHIRTPHFLRYKAAAERMVRAQRLVPINPILLCAQGGPVPSTVAQGAMVRIAVISVDPAQLDAYKAFLTEEQEASVRLEPGVLMLHSIQYADDPTQVRLLEVYASREAYESHIRTPHFLKYKTGTERMVTSLELPLADPIGLAAKPADQAGGPAACL